MFTKGVPNEDVTVHGLKPAALFTAISEAKCPEGSLLTQCLGCTGSTCMGSTILSDKCQSHGANERATATCSRLFARTEVVISIYDDGVAQCPEGLLLLDCVCYSEKGYASGGCLQMVKHSNAHKCVGAANFPAKLQALCGLPLEPGSLHIICKSSM